MIVSEYPKVVAAMFKATVGYDPYDTKMLAQQVCAATPPEPPKPKIIPKSIPTPTPTSPPPGGAPQSQVSAKDFADKLKKDYIKAGFEAGIAAEKSVEAQKRVACGVITDEAKKTLIKQGFDAGVDAEKSVQAQQKSAPVRSVLHSVLQSVNQTVGPTQPRPDSPAKPVSGVAKAAHTAVPSPKAVNAAPAPKAAHPAAPSRLTLLLPDSPSKPVSGTAKAAHTAAPKATHPALVRAIHNSSLFEHNSAKHSEAVKAAARIPPHGAVPVTLRTEALHGGVLRKQLHPPAHKHTAVISAKGASGKHGGKHPVYISSSLGAHDELVGFIVR